MRVCERGSKEGSFERPQEVGRFVKGKKKRKDEAKEKKEKAKKKSGTEESGKHKPEGKHT